MQNQLLPLRLKEAREKKGISKAEAARRLNMSKIGYSRYEYGNRTPSIQTVEIIAQCFGTSVDYLLGEADDMAPDYIVIHKKVSPELYEIVKDFSSLDTSSLNRILKYYKEAIIKKEIG